MGIKKKREARLVLLLILAMLVSLFPPAEMFRVKEAKAANSYSIEDYNTKVRNADLPKQVKDSNTYGYYMPGDCIYFDYRPGNIATDSPTNLRSVEYLDYNGNPLCSLLCDDPPYSSNDLPDGSKVFYLTVKSSDDDSFYVSGSQDREDIEREAQKREDFARNFACWTLAVTESSDAEELKDFTFTAKRKDDPDLFTITYLNYDDSIPKSDLPPYYIRGTGIPSLPDTFKSGYNFEGWFDENNQKVISISTERTGNITLTARFSPVGVQVRPAIHEPRVTPVLYKYFGITYVMDGGTNDSRNPTSYRENETVTLYDAWKTGATFDGWYLKPNGTSKVVTISGRNLTIYAHFTPYRYKITYCLYGGEMDWGNPDFYEYGRMPTFEVEPTRENSRFVGWSMSPDGSNPFKTLPDGTTGDLTLYAVYQPVYHITYVLEGGENNPDNPSDFFATDTVTLKDATKPDMKFAGWYDAPAGGNRVTTVSGGRNVTVYARFIPAYPIYYELEGGENNPNNPDYYEPGKGALIQDPYRRGYDFAGWFIGGTNVATRSISASHTGEVVLYAQWTPVPDLKGATVYLEGDRDLVYNATGQSVSLKKIVTRDGRVIKSFKNCRVTGLTAWEAGTHEVTVRGDGDRLTGKCTARFRIAKARLQDTRIKLSQSVYTFEPGVQNKPDVRFVLNGICMNMKRGRDYTVKYESDVTHAGTKRVVVRTTVNCNNLLMGDCTLTYEVKKAPTTFTAKVDPDTFSIWKLRHLRQVAHVSITDLSQGSEKVRYFIYRCSDSDRIDDVTVDSESGKVILLPAKWGQCEIRIKCISKANSDRKRKVEYVTIKIE